MSDGGATLAAAAVNRYLNERTLGQGGMGTVYLVRDRETGEQLALKKLARIDPKSVLRLKREFRSLADMHHQNLVKYYELGRAGDGWFLTMEYVDGCDLLSYLRPEDVDASGIDAAMSKLLERTAAAHEHVLPAFQQLARGVQALHRAGMLHRDLKPSNVLVAKRRVVVLDFGLVRELDVGGHSLTEEGAIAGTPAYMAPEQARGKPLDEASDWYAFGVMLYEALTGELPFDGPMFELVRQKLESEPIPPHDLEPTAPLELSQLCMALLERDPAARPKGAEIIARLEQSAPAAQPKEVSLQPAEDITLSIETTQNPIDEVPFFGRKRELAQLWEALRKAEKDVTVVAHVRGRSGAGKSALVECFLGELELQAPPSGATLVLRGRCHEREAMPFKALDSVMDALVRHLAHLDDITVGHLLPADIDVLAQLFPVLERLRAVQRLLTLRKPAGDALQNRQRAEAAFRDLLGRLAARQTVVIWIDDLQWGDLDSASILKTWLQRPAAAPLLLVFSYRSDEAETSECLKLLLQPGHGAPEPAAPVHAIDVDALADEDVKALCRRRLGPLAHGQQQLIEHIVRESQGSPFLAAHLAGLSEAKLARGDENVAKISIGELVAETSALLPTPAKHLLAVLAVAGRPMLPALALRAAGIRRGGRELVHALRSLSLLRTRDVAGERLLEVYHDRVREGAARALSAAQLERIFGALLAVLEHSGRADPDWLHILALGAGQEIAALRYGLAAAERASATLAFERAAELYRRCIELSQGSAENRRDLFCKLAETLGCCGRGTAAAEAYLEASKLSSRQEAVPLMRLAASHLLRSGHFEAGEALLGQVLEAMDLRFPQKDSSLMAAIVWERIRLHWRGLRHTTRHERELPAALLARIDLVDALGLETAWTDPLRTALFKERSLRWALEAGEPKRVVRALCSASEGRALSESSQRATRQTDRMIELASTIADRLGTPETRAAICAARTRIAFLRGAPADVLEPSAEAERLYRSMHQDGSNGGYFARFSVVAPRIGALFALGRYRSFADELRAALEEAHATENRAALLQLALNETILDALSGRPEQAIPRLEQQRRQLPPGRFASLHALHMIAVAWAANATFEYAWGMRCMTEDWERYQRSPVRRGLFLALIARTAYLRLSLNAQVGSGRVQGLAARAQPALRAIARLTPDVKRSAPVLAFRARLAHLGGGSAEVVELLRAAILRFDELGMAGEAARERYALGLLVGGSEGEALRVDADRSLRDNGVVDPAALVGGFWPELVRR